MVIGQLDFEPRFVIRKLKLKSNKIRQNHKL